MTATYSIVSLATSTKDQIRFLLGDVDTADFQMQDEELVYAYAVSGSTRGAAAMCAEALAAKYARLTSVSADGVSMGFNQLSAQFLKLAVELRQKEAIYRAMPTLGGVSISDMDTVLSNTDRVPDIFRIGIHDDPPSSLDGIPARFGALPDDQFGR